MKFKTVAASMATAAILAATSGSAHATTVAGVTWDPNYLLDFEAAGTVYENTTNTVGAEIKGHGQITAMNNSTTFCPTCQLTYEFGGFVMQDWDATPGGASAAWQLRRLKILVYNNFLGVKRNCCYLNGKARLNS